MTSESPESKIHNPSLCYSAGEYEAMHRNQQWRARLLHPLLAAMSALRVAPDHVTILSLLVGFSFCPLYFVQPAYAFAALALHVLLDGLDGPLARFQGVASKRGSFTDTIVDQLVIFATTLTLMAAGVIGLVPGTMYLFIYTVLVSFAMVRSALAIPYSWVVRPRFVVYVWFLVEHYLWPGTIDYVILACNLVMAWKLVTGFINLRRKIGELE